MKLEQNALASNTFEVDPFSSSIIFHSQSQQPRSLLETTKISK
jgi:hypothetical protein